MDELPVAVGMIVCRRVERDTQSGLLTIRDRINGIRSRAFPTKPTELAIYASFINGFGTFPLMIRVRLLETDELIRVHRSEIEFRDRLHEVPYRFSFDEMSFPAAGTYEFELELGTEPLARVLIRVRSHETGESP
jgi:hypothetical protein